MTILTHLLPNTIAATGPTANCTTSFFGLKTWYSYLPSSDFTNCSITKFNPLDNNGIPLILLAVVDDLLRIAALVAVGYIFVGAFRYITSQGNPDGTSQAQQTVINALIGLAISVVAVAVVSFIGSTLKG